MGHTEQMLMYGLGFFPLLFGLIWIGFVVFVLVLATRLVRNTGRIADAVEKIATQMKLDAQKKE